MTRKIEEECLDGPGRAAHGWAHADAHGGLESTVTSCACSCVDTVTGDYYLAGNLEIRGWVSDSSAKLLAFGDDAGKREGATEEFVGGLDLAVLNGLADLTAANSRSSE